MVPKAYMWKGGKWEYVGEVMAQGAASKKAYEGDRLFPKGEYDYVFEVDIRDGAPKVKLPFNEGDNPLVTAERFLVRENMSMDLKPQIIDFIKKNTRSTGKPTPSAPAKPAAPPKPAHCFLMRQTVFYEQMNIDGLSKKLTEINTALLAESSPSALSENELQYVLSIASKLRDPALYTYIKEFSSFEIDNIKKLLKWPAEHCIPVVDLWRCLVLHHASQLFFAGLDSGLPIIAGLTGKLKNGPAVLWTVYFKCLSNMIKHQTNSTALSRAKDVISEGFKHLDFSNQKALPIVANYLMNLSSNIDTMYKVEEGFISGCLEQISTVIKNSAAILDSESILKLSIALGNFVCFKPELSAQSKQPAEFLIEKLGQMNDGVAKDLKKGLETLIVG